MIRNKAIIIGVGVVVLVCGIVITSIVLSRNAEPVPVEQAPKSAQEDTAPKPDADLSLHLEGFTPYPDVDSATQATIANSINRYLANVARTSTPIGVLREQSYKKTVNGSVTNITFLIDIANLKRSYKISIGKDTSTTENSMYILCPSSEELIYPAFDCKDDLSE